MFGEADIANLAYQLLYTLNYMHKNGFIHRDIKPNNILINPLEGNKISCKVCDFEFVTTSKNKDPETEGLAGTPIYMAPEIIKKQN